MLVNANMYITVEILIVIMHTIYLVCRARKCECNYRFESSFDPYLAYNISNVLYCKENINNLYGLSTL